MADLEKTVSILFKGVDDVSATTDKIGGSLSNLGSSLESATKPFADVAESVEKLDVALAALVAGGLYYAYTEYSSLTSAVAELDKVLGDNSAGLEAAKQNAFDLSQQYGTSMKDILASTADFVQAGFSVEEAMTLVKNSMDLSIAGQIEAGKASEYLVQILKGFKAPAEDAARVVDVLNETSNVYATDVNKLAEGMARISPIAKLMGFSFEETAALLTPIIEVFQSGEQAADALKIGLLKLSDDSKPVTDALYALGVAQTYANGELRPTKDILADIQAKFTTLTSEQKTFYTSQLVGLEQTPRMIEVFNGGAKSAEILATALKAAGSASEEVAKQLATPQKQMDILQTSFVNLAEAIGEKYGASAASVISSSNDIVLALQTALGDGAFSAILSSINTFLTDFSTYIKDVAKAIPDAFKQVDFSEFLESLSELQSDVGALFTKMFGSFDLTQPEDMAKAIQKIVDAGTKLITFSEGIAEGLKPFAEQMGVWINNAIAADDKTVKLAGAASGLGQGIYSLVSTLNILGPALGIFTGAVMIDAISNVGKMVLALGGLANPATLAVGALIVTAAAVTKLDTDSQEAIKQMYAFGGAMNEFENSIYESSKPVETLSETLNEFPEYKSLMFETDIDSAINQIQGLNDNLLVFETGVSVLIDADPSPANERIGELSNKMADYQNRTYSADFAITDISYQETKDRITEITNVDGTKLYINVGVDEKSVRASMDKIKEIPTEKMMEIKLQGDIDKELATIKSNADNMQSAMEWTAKLVIAQIEAETEKVKAMFTSVSDTIGSVSSEIGNLFGKVPKSEYDFGAREWQAAVKQAMQIQADGFKLEQKLVEEQIKLMKSKDDYLKSGKAMIKIDSTGLEPALEMIMWQILQKVQLKANEDAASFLLGI